jgi:hypothetical protein
MGQAYGNIFIINSIITWGTIFNTRLWQWFCKNYTVMKQIMDEIQKRFAEALEVKTGWGKNEVLELYNSIASEVYLENLSLLMERGK